jgi:nitronate monooxygenase
MAFDEARNTLGWPAQVDGRGIVNETVKDYEKGQKDLEERQKRYKKAEEEDDPERLIVWAGTGIERMDPKTSRLPAFDTAKQIWSEAQIAMQG